MNIRFAFNRINEFAAETSIETGIPKLLLIIGCIWNCMLGRCTIRDYFLYKFYNLSRRGKHEFISNTEMVAWSKKHSSAEHMGILDVKDSSLDFFKDFIKRDWCSDRYNCSEENYAEFLKKHDRCILKPIDGTCGEGIELIELNGFDAHSLKELCREKNAVVEELIVQHDELASLYPGSVNTLRIATLNGKIIGAVLRMGMDNSFTDNFSKGGIIANVDIGSGVITGSGKTQHSAEHLVHPDTKTVIPGFRVPMWDECKDFALSLAEQVCGLSFVGWDIAITNDGPTFVEGNEESEIAVFQMSTGKGLRRSIEEKRDLI